MVFALRPFLVIALGLAGRALAAGEAPSAGEIVDLPPFQVLGKSLSLRAHTVKRDGKRLLEYIRVDNVAPGSLAEEAGLRKGDRILAIAGWSLAGQEFEAINRDFPTKPDGNDRLLALTVQRNRKQEFEILLRFPQKKPTDPPKG